MSESEHLILLQYYYYHMLRLLPPCSLFMENLLHPHLLIPIPSSPTAPHAVKGALSVWTRNISAYPIIAFILFCCDCFLPFPCTKVHTPETRGLFYILSYPCTLYTLFRVSFYKYFLNE